jgi:phenylalanyl-tRNA synthetase beta chain
VIRSGERHRLRSEASTRWEKGVDPEGAGLAARYASQLLAELTGARFTGETEVRGQVPPPPAIAYRPGYADEAVGLATPEGEQRERLERLGFEIASDWTVRVPSWRARDVRRDVDVVEEVARFRLEEVPATLPRRQAMFGRLTHEQRLRRLVADVLVGAGLYEAYTYSLQHDDPDPNALELPEPLSSQQRVLRTTLATGLLGAARHNLDAGNADIALFEIAHVYLPPGPVPEERWRLGGIVQGDFFRATGIVEAVFEAVHVKPTWSRVDLGPELLVAAAVQSGWVGTYSPALPLEGEWSAFELDLADLFALVPERLGYRDVITYPPLRQDFAFVVDEGVPAGALIAAVREAGGDEVGEVRFLSDYRGEPIPPGKKSVALAVAFQSDSRTLSEEDGARLRQAVVDALAAAFGATLRA